MKKFDYMRIGLAVLFTALGFTLTGCQTGKDAENVSARPWNSPVGWEGGMPSSFYDRNRR